MKQFANVNKFNENFRFKKKKWIYHSDFQFETQAKKVGCSIQSGNYPLLGGYRWL